MRELRSEAEKKLVPKFDERKFQDTVLESGAALLSILEVQTKKWIEMQAAQ